MEVPLEAVLFIGGFAIGFLVGLFSNKYIKDPVDRNRDQDYSD